MNNHGRWTQIHGTLLLMLASAFWVSLGFPPLQQGDAGAPAAVQRDTTGTTLYLPLVITPPRPPSDLEITQTVQQPGNPVTLVTGRPTFMRYTLTSEAAHPGVNAYLYGYRDGFPLPGSPLSAINNPRTLETVANRADINDTFNFDLPVSWTNGTISLWGAANNDTTFEIVEGPVTATFTENNPLPIMVVPIAYTCTSGGSGTTTPTGPFDYLDDDANKLYPVPSTDLTTHLPIAYAGPCSSGQPYPDYDAGDWHDMLYSIRDLWITEGRPNRYYYGLVNIYCGGSCIAGLGYIGGNKAAVGWNGWGSGHTGASGTHAHELGHNHGLSHAPGCGAGNPDPNYPYASGLIGDSASPNYGYDIDTDGIKPYPSYYDFMTYCSSEWISDYNFEKLYLYEQSQAAMSPEVAIVSSDALLVSGFLLEDGSVEINPTFQLELPITSPRSGSYMLELLDGEGSILAQHHFDMITAAADGVGGTQGGEQRSFALMIPHLDGIERMRVIKDGQMLGETHSARAAAASEMTPPMARIDAGVLHVAWSSPEGRAFMVRLSLDGGTTWQTVGVNLDLPELNLPLSVPESADLQLEILASDGIHTERILLSPDSVTR